MAVKSGADEKTIEVRVEVDSQQNKLRAIATGATELRSKTLGKGKKTNQELIDIVSDNLKQDPSAIEICGENDYYTVLTSHIVKKQMIFLHKEYNPVRVIDKEGVIRLQKVNAQVRTINLGGWKNTVDKLLKESTVFGDGGEEVPNIYIIADSRVIDLSGMQSREQILTLGEAELKSFSGNSDLIIICTLTTQNQRG